MPEVKPDLYGGVIGSSDIITPSDINYDGCQITCELVGSEIIETNLSLSYYKADNRPAEPDYVFLPIAS